MTYLCSILLSSAAALLIAAAVGEMLDSDIARLTRNAAVFALASVFAEVFRVVAHFALFKVGSRLVLDVRRDLFASVIAQGQAFHERHPVGDLTSRIVNDTERLSHMVAPGASLMLESVVSVVVPLLLLARLRWELLIVPTAFLVIHVVTLRRHMRVVGTLASAYHASALDLDGRLEERLAAIELVKTQAREHYEVRRHLMRARTLRSLFIARGNLDARYLPFLFFHIAQALVFVHALWLFDHALLSASGVIAALGLVSLLRLPTFCSVIGLMNIQSGVLGARSILGISQMRNTIEEPPSPRPRSAPVSVPMRGAICFRDVTLRYQRREVLQNVSFRVDAGQTVALVGQTGAGKTSLLKLLNRTLDPCDGVVAIDGIDTRSWEPSSLRAGIATIEQDVYIFARSVADNIAYGNPEAQRCEIEQAAKDAQAHEFIVRLEQGYDTLLGSRGVTLSGGQRQRIALARAFLSNPSVLVLDDCTSALDGETVHELQNSLRRIQKGRTLVLVTNRTSMIRSADVILILERGRVLAQGNHEQLLRESPMYRRIFSDRLTQPAAAEPPRSQLGLPP